MGPPSVLPLFAVHESNPGSKSQDYCKKLLMSVDCADSEDEVSMEEEKEVLPIVAIDMINSSGLKRSLLTSLDQVVENEKPKNIKIKWGPVLAQKPHTRGHGNVNIMQKAANYKRKQNLEVPHTYKGAKMAKYQVCTGYGGCSYLPMESALRGQPGCATPPMLEAARPSSRGAA